MGKLSGFEYREIVRRSFITPEIYRKERFGRSFAKRE